MQEPEFTETVRNMRRHTTRMERAGGYWSPGEKQQLEHLFLTGVGITEIAVRLQRTEPAVIQQIEKQDLYQRSQYRQRRRSPKDRCGCLCGRCGLDPECCSYRRAPVGEQEGV